LWGTNAGPGAARESAQVAAWMTVTDFEFVVHAGNFQPDDGVSGE
jgi:hypothetical protein